MTVLTSAAVSCVILEWVLLRLREVAGQRTVFAKEEWQEPSSILWYVLRAKDASCLLILG